MIEPISELAPRSYHAQKKLLKEAEAAIAWGIPDSESTGYSASQFTNIIRKLVYRIQELERENEQLRSQKH